MSSPSRSPTFLSSRKFQQLVQTTTRNVSLILALVDCLSRALSLSGETISPLLLISSTPILAMGVRPVVLHQFHFDGAGVHLLHHVRGAARSKSSWKIMLMASS